MRMNGSRAATGAAVTTPMKERSWTRVSLASQRPGREWLPRAVYVVIVVLVTITLCYQLCVQFSVSPLIIRDSGMTFVLRLHLGGRQCHRRFRLAGRRARGPLGEGQSRHVRPAGDRCAGSRWAAQRAEQGDLPGPVRGG